MIKRIILGLTGSELSQAAAQTAITWARLFDIELVAVTAIDVDRLSAGEAVPLGASAFKAQRDERLLSEAHAQADQWLSTFAAAAKSYRVVCDTRKREGDPAVVLSDEAQRGDLLLIGCNKVTKAGKHTLGVETLLRNATRPILLAPHGGVVPVDTVLIAYDGSPEAAKALEIFQLLGLASGRTVHLLCVAPDEAASASAEVAADYLRLHGHNVHVLKQTSRSAPGQVIVSEAERVGAGVIVMGAYGRGKWMQRLLGSVTTDVINHTRIPLFLHH